MCDMSMLYNIATKWHSKSFFFCEIIHSMLCAIPYHVNYSWIHDLTDIN